MNRKHYLLLVVLTIVAGLVGGAVSNRLFMARTAGAQETKQDGKVIAAEEFRLVDGEGKIRAALTDLGGYSGLVFYDSNGKRSSGFSVIGDVPSLLLLDSNENTRIMLSVEDDNPFMVFYDSNGKRRIGLTVTGDVPSLSFHDSNENTRIMLSVGAVADGVPSLVLADINGKKSIGHYVVDDKSYLGFTDRNRNLRVILSLGDDGACLEFYDENAKLRAALGTTKLSVMKTGESRTTAESSLVLFDKDSNVMWKAPPY